MVAAFTSNGSDTLRSSGRIQRAANRDYGPVQSGMHDPRRRARRQAARRSRGAFIRSAEDVGKELDLVLDAVQQAVSRRTPSLSERRPIKIFKPSEG